jgi:dynein heavy chain 2
VNSLDAVLMPVIRKEFLKSGPRLSVYIGDKSIDYNDDFSLYLVTNYSTFSLPSNMQGYVNTINFTITRDGLSGQLLGITLKSERPKLEEQKLQLIQQEDDYKIQLTKLEDQLLNELSSSQGNILENRSLIKSLEDTKFKSDIIAKSLSESQKLQESLDEERDKYFPIANFGSTLFFVVSDLKRLNNMYCFSLSSYLHLFDHVLKLKHDSIQEFNADTSVTALISSLQKVVYYYVSRSIFKSDCHTFALYFIHSLNPEFFEPNEWELLCGTLMSTDSPMDAPDWVPKERNSAFKKLAVTIV